MNKYPYPRAVSWLLFANVSKSHSLLIYNVVTGFEYELSEEQAHLLLSLDGKTNPNDLRGQMSEEELVSLIHFFQEEHLIRSSRVYIEGNLKLLTLWTRNYNDYKTPAKNIPIIYRAITMLLNIAWIPLFYYSLPLMKSNSYSVIGILMGTAIGAILHEAAHYIVARRFGAPVFEVCLLMQGVLPGVCVLIDDTLCGSRLKGVLMNFAGIQMNCVLAGLAVGIALRCPISSECFYGLGLSNFILAVTNALPFHGTDGSRILRLLFGSHRI